MIGDGSKMEEERIVCRCEEITEQEVLRAIKIGALDLDVYSRSDF